MDADATLREIRQLIKTKSERERLIELIDALDKWLSRGGMLPQEWWWNPK